MEESACHVMVIYISQRFSSMYVFVCFLYFSLVLNMIFTQADAERMIVKTRKMQRNICVDGLKNIVWHDTASVENNC